MLNRVRIKRLAVVLTGTVAAISLMAGGLLYLAGRAPRFYAQIEALSAADRAAESKQFVRQSTGVWNQIQNEPTWSGAFQQSQVNAWLAGDFTQKPVLTLPRGVSDPRVAFENGRLALAFRWKRGPVDGLIWVVGRMWLPEANLVAIEFEKIRAGLVPLPSGPVVDTLSAVAESAGLDLEWRQHAGNPVALLRLGRRDSEATIEIERLDLQQGMLHVAGHSRRSVPHDTAGTSGSTSTGVSLKDHVSDSDFVR